MSVTDAVFIVAVAAGSAYLAEWLFNKHLKYMIDKQLNARRRREGR